eukprot:10102842-Heterocapsa_arctica.AAC.1
MKILNDGGPNLISRLGKSRSYIVIKDSNRIYQFSCRLASDRSRKARLRCFAGMICMLMKHVDEWKPD